MQKWYLALTVDLEGYYIEFEADSKETVEQYLEEKYWGGQSWEIPRGEIFSEDQFMRIRDHRSSIKAKCGPLEADMFQ